MVREKKIAILCQDAGAGLVGGSDGVQREKRPSYLSESFACDPPAAAFFLFGVGMRHSMEKATQLVQGTPRLAASQRT